MKRLFAAMTPVDLVHSMLEFPAAQRAASWWSRSRARQVLRSLRPWQRGTIVMYHRIGEPSIDPWELSVSPQRFAEQLDVLKSHFEVVPLARFAEEAESGGLNRRAVAVTFDDGYADNLIEAKPLLEKYDLPATVFVSSGGIDCQREFWWDELDRVFLHPHELPDELELTFPDGPRRWPLSDGASLDDAQYQRHVAWRIWQPAVSGRCEIYLEVWRLLQSLPHNQQQKILDQIASWAAAAPPPRGSHRTLTRAELAVLADGGLVEIGGHSVTHAMLTCHNAAFQRVEIGECQKKLEEVLGNQITSFSYPYGKCDSTTVALVKEGGLSRACIAGESLLPRKFDRYRLPRFGVSDWDGDEFSRRMA